MFARLTLVLMLGIANAPNPAIAEEPAFGTYGYGHKKLHEQGSVQQLIDRMKHGCCDGGKGGECRVTEIRLQSPSALFRHGDVWCPIPKNVEIRADVTLPKGVFSMICASSYLVELTDGRICPGFVYCAAMYYGG